MVLKMDKNCELNDFDVPMLRHCNLQYNRCYIYVFTELDENTGCVHEYRQAEIQ